MVRKRKAWVPLLVALGVALGVFGLLLPDSGSVAAQATPTATRSLPSSVSAGENFTVSITVSGYGGFGAVTETLPAGFTYVSSSLPDSQITHISASKIQFGLFNDSDFTYVVTAPATAGDNNVFSGVLRDSERAEHPLIDSTIAVTAAVVDDTPTPTPSPVPTPDTGGPSATRFLSATQVDANGSLTVTINASNYGAFGRVLETLPSGFSFVSSNLPSTQVDASGSPISFTLFGETSFDYTVTASNRPGPHTFSGGVLRDSQRMEHDIPDSTVTVVAPAGGPSATRSVPSEYVEPGGTLEVTIEASDYGSFGSVVEMIPSEFTYVSSSLSAQYVNQGSDSIRFTLFEDSSFTYTVTAPMAEGGPYTFTGTLIDDSRAEHPMANTSVMVGTPPTPTPTPVPPTATPRPDVTPTAPTRTPRPTAVPPAPPTPVATEKADVTAVEGAMTVQPDASAIVASADGAATVMLPNTSRARTYQVMVVTDAENCSGAGGALQACALVKTFDAEGNAETDVELIRRATVVLTLSSSMVDDLGGLPVVFQANALGGFSVYQQNADGAWSMRRFSMGLNDDGGVMATVTGLRTLGAIALTVDEDILQTAMYQVAGITPTAVPTPEPTAVPTPEPTAVPVDREPEVGDATAPVGLLIVLALTGALMIYTGSRVMRGRRSAVR